MSDTQSTTDPTTMGPGFAQDPMACAQNILWDVQIAVNREVLIALGQSSPDLYAFFAQLKCVRVVHGDQLSLQWGVSVDTLVSNYYASIGVPDASAVARDSVATALELLGYGERTIIGAVIENLVRTAPPVLTETVASFVWRLATAGTKAGTAEKSPHIQAAFEECPSPVLHEIVIQRAAVQERASGIMSMLDGVVDPGRAAAITRDHITSSG